MGKKLFVFFVLFFMLIAVVLFNPGCKSSSEVTGTWPAKNATVVISEFTSTAIRDNGSTMNHTSSAKAEVEYHVEPTGDPVPGYIYELKVSLQETGGVPAKITAVDFTFLSGGSSFGSFSAFVGAFFGSTSISANGTLTSETLDITSKGSYPFAEEIQVKVSYSDSSGKPGSVEAWVHN